MKQHRSTLPERTMHQLGLATVRARVNAGKYTDADVAKWKKELGSIAVDKVLAAHAPKREAAAPASKKSTPTKE